ncbi:NADPH-dependent aldehyde reductase 1, chloroplastic [Rhodotorula toruloides]|nr:NADPH-dependent aldehyde reductase 1, chloroplastic [Rhodotorula toruloides]
MQAAADAVKSAVQNTGASSSGSSTVQDKFSQGWKPDANAEKAAQGGDDSRPPGTQHTMKDKPVDDILADGTPYKPAAKLEGKAILITGGDSGIGRATAILAALEGANVAIAYLPQEQKDADDTKAYIEKRTNNQSKVLLLPLDLKSEANCIKAVDETVANFGRLDVLFNNAAQQLENKDITTLDSKQWEDTFQINMHHMFYTSKAAIPHLAKTKGNIVNNASVNAFIGRPDLLDYTSTKGSIVAFTRGLANQQAEKGIRVNAVAPGPILTPLVPATFSRENLEGTNAVPLGRTGQPIEIAAPVIFLASSHASYITGHCVMINGGQASPLSQNTRRQRR